MGVPVSLELAVPVALELGVPVWLKLAVPVALELGVPVPLGDEMPVTLGVEVISLTATHSIAASVTTKRDCMRKGVGILRMNGTRVVTNTKNLNNDAQSAMQDPAPSYACVLVKVLTDSL